MTDPNRCQDDPSEAELDQLIAEQRPTMPPKDKGDWDRTQRRGPYIPEMVLRGRGIRSSDARPKRRRANW